MKIAGKYILYRIVASNGKGHGIHSPFVFQFITEVLNDRTLYPAYLSIEKLRRKLLSDNTPVPVEDYGAGSAIAGAAQSKSIASITLGAAKSPKYARLLHRMVKYYEPHYVLELGTSLGISTAYLASADNKPVVVTGEGNQFIAKKAQQNLDALGLNNIRIVKGNFDNTLPQMLSALPRVDLAFVDGNHREQPTLNYFNQLVDKMPGSSILIFDDIHWSGGMESAWHGIKQHPSVMLTIDLFAMGIIFFRPGFKVKQHFRIRF